MVDSSFRMPARPGAHTVYLQGADLVIEWYDFGDHAPYESANLLIFDRDGQAKFASALGFAEYDVSTLAEQIAQRFDSYFEAQAFAKDRDIPYRKEVDFQP